MVVDQAMRAILAQPSSSIDGKLRLTEQGEIIEAKYGNYNLGLYNLEALVSATLLKSYDRLEKGNFSKYDSIITRLAKNSEKKYRDLVFNTQGFEDFFFDVSPISEISQLNLGSRPSSRKKGKSIEDLRAIPWVFSWSQMRIMLPGWYGLGSALKEEKIEILQQMYENWDFFRAQLSNVDMLLAKTDMDIASEYIKLAKDQKSL